MNASELRIGNLITQIKYANGNCDVIREVTAIRQEGSLNVRVIGAHNMKSHPAEWFSPILLTEKWLSKFGFKPNEYQNGWLELGSLYISKDKFELGFYDSEYGVGEYTIELKYVHQLQNLFYCLTGKELSACQ